MTVAEKQTQGIAKSWSLVDFRKEYGPIMKIGECTNKATKETFDTVEFKTSEKSSPTFVNFSSKLGSLTAKQLTKQRNELQVVQLAVSKSYIICKAGEGFDDSDFTEVAEW